jgi:hypothetical protein
VSGRILGRYLDALKRSRDEMTIAGPTRHAFEEEFPEDSPEQRLLRGEFRKCVPVLGDDPCAWAFDGAIQQGWDPIDDGIPVTSPWECWFLDVQAPKTISWASGAPEVPWEGPPVWGWVIRQGQRFDGPEGVGWIGSADLVLPHDMRRGEPATPAVKEWRIGWALTEEGMLGGRGPAGTEFLKPVIAPATVPFWRTLEEAKLWTPALSAPLFRTLQLLNCAEIEVGIHRPERPKRKVRRGKRKGRRDRRDRSEVVYRVLQIEAGAGYSRRPGGGGGSSEGDSLLRRRHLRRGHFKKWGYHKLVEREDGSKVCSKCGEAEGSLSSVCGTGHFGSGRKLVRWINQTTVGSREAGELEKMYSVVEHDHDDDQAAVPGH